MSKNASKVSSSCRPKAVWKMLHSTWEKNSANDLPYERMTVTTQSDGKKNSCFGKLKLLCSQETHSVIFVNSVRISVCFHFLNCFRLLSRRKSYHKKSIQGSVRVKKTKKNWPPPKLIFCHKLSPLDWIMVIWAIFGLPGPSGGSGGPMWGLGGPAGIKFTNFHMWLFLALRCHFLDLTQSINQCLFT